MGVVITSMVLVAMVGVSAASAGSFRTNAKWKNCDTTQSAVNVTATFADVVRYHGPGRYKVKKAIRWDTYKGNGQWRARDTTKSATGWIRITNPSYDFVSSVGDKTTWGALYPSNWRAHVTLTLVKDRRGPIDKKVDKVDIFPQKGSYREVGQGGGPYCGDRRPPGVT